MIVRIAPRFQYLTWSIGPGFENFAMTPESNVGALVEALDRWLRKNKTELTC